MDSVSAKLNTPLWSKTNPKIRGFNESWNFKMSDPAHNRALSLRFNILIAENGFRKVSEVWAVYSERGSDRELKKIAVRQSQGIDSFSTPRPGEVRIGNCSFGPTTTRGSIQSKGHTIEWDLNFASIKPITFNRIPQVLRKYKLVRDFGVTVAEDLVFSGTAKIDGREVTWTAAKGMQSHLAGPHTNYAWVWAHSNTMEQDQGEDSGFIFEALSTKSRWFGKVHSPEVSSFFFWYKGAPHVFNGIWQSVRCQSKHTLKEWTFRVEQGELSFRGKISAELKDFIGLAYEDTDGSQVHAALSQGSNSKIQVFRRGKLEVSYSSSGGTSYEVASRARNQHVPSAV